MVIIISSSDDACDGGARNDDENGFELAVRSAMVAMISKGDLFVYPKNKKLRIVLHIV